MRKPVWATMRWSGRTDIPSMFQPRWRTSMVSASSKPLSTSRSRSCTAWVIAGV
ncbi:MAG: hypothetical protein R2711_03425 [Acidimicrobiales bacterium]